MFGRQNKIGTSLTVHYIECWEVGRLVNILIMQKVSFSGRNILFPMNKLKFIGDSVFPPSCGWWALWDRGCCRMCVNCSPEQQTPLKAGGSQELYRSPYPIVLTASVTNSGSDVNASSVARPRQRGWLHSDAEHLMNDYFQLWLSKPVLQSMNSDGRLQNTKNSQSISSFSFSVALALSRSAGDYFPGTDLRSSHIGQVLVILSVSDASPPLF